MLLMVLSKHVWTTKEDFADFTAYADWCVVIVAIKEYIKMEVALCVFE